MLNAGVVDEDVDGAKPARCFGDKAADLGGLRHVGRDKEGAHPMPLGESGAQALDRGGIAKAVQHDIAALGGERGRDADPNAAGRAGDNSGPALQHRLPP